MAAPTPILRSILIGGCAGLLPAAAIFATSSGPIRVFAGGMSYADLAATLLAASALLVAIIGIFIAVLAVWGFATFRSMTENSAREYLADQLRDGEIRTYTQKIVTEFLENSIDDVEFRRLFEERLDRIIVQGAAARASQATSESDVAVSDL